MNRDELNSILDSHNNWLRGNGGERADLFGADLSNADLRGANLSNAGLVGSNLSGSNMRGAGLFGSNLFDANLSGADLRCANLHGVDLSGSNLVGSNMSGSSLVGSNLFGADLRGADLSGANLVDAGLVGSNLVGADLSGTTGNLSEIKSFFSEKYPITYTAEVMQIGCENHSISDWWSFDDERISKMDRGALEWWQKWKPVLQQIIDMSPATPTGHEGEMK